MIYSFPIPSKQPDNCHSIVQRAAFASAPTSLDLPILERTTAARFTDLHFDLGIARLPMPTGIPSPDTGGLNQKALRFTIGRKFSEILVRDFLQPHALAHRETHGLMDEECQVYDRKQLVDAMSGIPPELRYVWCTRAVARTLHELTHCAKRVYGRAASLLASGTLHYQLDEETRYTRYFAGPLDPELVSRYERVNSFIRRSPVIDFLAASSHNTATVFDIIDVGLNTVRSISIGLLHLLPRSFDHHVARSPQMIEWDALSYDLLRSIREISLTHNELLGFFRGDSQSKATGGPVLAIEPEDILIGRRNGLLKVEIGDRPFNKARAEVAKGEIEDLVGCAGHTSIPPVYRWIRGIVRDLIVEPQLRAV